MKIRSKIDDIKMSLDGACIISLIAPKTALKTLFSLKDKDLDVEIKKHSKKRSLNANAYAWVLMTRIAEEMSKDCIVDKWSIYKNLLKKYSISYEYLVVKKDALPRLEKAFRVVETLGEGMLGDEKAYQVQAYYGSSTFTQDEMRVFLDGVVYEAKELEIETETPDELERMKSLWDKKSTHHQ